MVMDACVIFADKLKSTLPAACRGAHSPDERIEISTVEPFWQTTLQLLGRLADVKA